MALVVAADASSCSRKAAFMVTEPLGVAAVALAECALAGGRLASCWSSCSFVLRLETVVMYSQGRCLASSLTLANEGPMWARKNSEAAASETTPTLGALRILPRRARITLKRASFSATVGNGWANVDHSVKSGRYWVARMVSKCLVRRNQLSNAPWSSDTPIEEHSDCGVRSETAAPMRRSW